MNKICFLCDFMVVLATFLLFLTNDCRVQSTVESISNLTLQTIPTFLFEDPIY
jgi:hypothetical protein